MTNIQQFVFFVLLSAASYILYFTLSAPELTYWERFPVGLAMIFGYWAGKALQRYEGEKKGVASE